MFLQLPLRYALPLMVVSALAHWVISQSFFVMAVEYSGMDGLIDNATFYAAGYSVMAIIIALALGGALILTLLVVGMRRLPATGIPFVGCCSAAISAACHGEVEATEPLRWGVVADYEGKS
ncbi:hypothetical protein K461DRAFT_276457 [Myriangium duriaei CBS 260.36]|uniref:Uncharacterized protein n=1 Tax=Myriangium duriaei CBS 260.36 TaxID=1168546 RepID=A0A9P4J8V0_9PEZI|nr:hypothetical protein K461DRAFT_276457 [Myriangium duriaei CBS 260.36]